MRNLLLLVFLFFAFNLYSQNKQHVDSLVQELTTTIDNEQRFNLFVKIAIEYMFTDIDKAIKIIDKTNEIALSLNSDSLLFESNMLYGVYYSGKKQNFIALRYLMEALELAQKLDEAFLIANAAKGISSIYLHLGNEIKAYEFAKLGNETLLKHQDKNNPVLLDYQAYVLTYLGKSYLKLDSLPQAFKCLNDAYSYFSARNEFDNMSYLNNELGIYYAKIQNIDSSNYQYNLGLKHANLSGKDAWLLVCKLGLAKNLLAINQLDSSKILLNQVIELSKKIHIPLYATEAYGILSDIYIAQKNYQMAYQSQKTFKSFSDSIMINDRRAEVARLEEQMRYEKQKQAEQQLNKIKEYRIYLLILSLVLLAAILLILFFWQRSKAISRRQKQKQLSNKLIYKDSELASKTMLMLKQTQHIEEINKKLKEIKLLAKTENKSKIEEIIHDLALLKDLNIWKEFDKRFKTIHPEFYERLNASFPNLSPNERKLCAFVKMKLTTKEIAYFTNSNLNTIKIAKYRLRKKLNITNTKISIESFIENY